MTQGSELGAGNCERARPSTCQEHIQPGLDASRGGFSHVRISLSSSFGVSWFSEKGFEVWMKAGVTLGALGAPGLGEASEGVLNF